MSWTVTAPGFLFSWDPDQGYSPDVAEVLPDEYRLGVPYLFTGAMDFTLNDERVVYMAAKTYVETWFPDEHDLRWSDTNEPLPPIPEAPTTDQTVY